MSGRIPSKEEFEAVQEAVEEVHDGIKKEEEEAKKKSPEPITQKFPFSSETEIEDLKRENEQLRKTIVELKKDLDERVKKVEEELKDLGKIIKKENSE